MDIVINVKVGGFGLSRKAIIALGNLGQDLAKEELAEVEGDNADDEQYGRNIDRNDPLLIKVVRDLGDEANGHYAALKIVTIPGDVAWQVESDDTGCEWVAEEHRIWD
jgi:hypothetical protein